MAPRCSPTAAARTACRRRFAASSPASWPRCANSPCSMRRTSTPTSDLPTAASRPRRWPGVWTTAPARCGSSATDHNIRVECRVPGGDVNQYLAVAALIAGGLYGIEQDLELPEPCAGNAYETAERASGCPPRWPRPPRCLRRRRVARRRVRRRRGRALPEQRPRGAGGIQRGGHRLGEDAWV